jgi:hypothetical protein
MRRSAQNEPYTAQKTGVGFSGGISNATHGEAHMKRTHSRIIVILGTFLATTSALAGPATDALTTCVADSTTGKDRKELAQWVFVAMSSHPELQPLAHVDDAQRDEMDKKLASLATRLITENCAAQAKAAIEKEGIESFKAAFGALGRLAMQELMSNKSVNEAFTRYTKYLDKAKFDAAFGKQ